MLKIKNKHKCKIRKTRAGYWNAACYSKKCAGMYPWFFQWTDALAFVIEHQKSRGVK